MHRPAEIGRQSAWLLDGRPQRALQPSVRVHTAGTEMSSLGNLEVMNTPSWTSYMDTYLDQGSGVL